MALCAVMSGVFMVKMGLPLALGVPLAILFGNEAISYRLKDSGARVLITDRANTGSSTSCLAFKRLRGSGLMSI